MHRGGRNRSPYKYIIDGEIVELPKRKPTRLKDYDYSSPGAYFITICTKDRRPLFWQQPVGADIIRPKSDKELFALSEYGKIVDTAINAIEQHYENIYVDKYVIMPNHIHLILKILSDNKNGRILSATTIIGQMKRWISKKIGFSVWQKSFHDHIIRDEKDSLKIWNYIDTNPYKWEEDCFYTKSI